MDSPNIMPLTNPSEKGELHILRKNPSNQKGLPIVQVKCVTFVENIPSEFTKDKEIKLHNKNMMRFE